MNGLPLGELATAAGCLLIASLAGGADGTLTSLPEARLQAMRDELGGAAARRIGRYLDDPARILTSLLAFRVTTLFTAAVLATNALAGGREVFWKLATIVAVLSFGYGAFAALFATIGRTRGHVLAPAALAFARPIELLIRPIAVPLIWIGNAIEARLALHSHSEPPQVTEREVEYVVEQAEESGALDPKRGQMLQNVLELKDLTARDVMVPRTAMHAIEAQTSFDRALAIVTEEGHSRVPVFRGQIDNVIGVLHVKDLFRVARPGGVDGHSVPPPPEYVIESLARKPAFFVAETQSALAVLRDLQARRTHMAIVVDEFGAVAGLVTLEDILERLVGDIQDEHDSEESQLLDQGNGRYLAAAAISLRKLGDQLAVEFPDAEAYASLGGFLADRAGKVPAVGTVVEWNGLTFTVREGDARHATKVEIVRKGRTARVAVPAASAAE